MCACVCSLSLSHPHTHIHGPLVSFHHMGLGCRCWSVTGSQCGSHQFKSRSSKFWANVHVLAPYLRLESVCQAVEKQPGAERQASSSDLRDQSFQGWCLSESRVLLSPRSRSRTAVTAVTAAPASGSSCSPCACLQTADWICQSHL